MHYPASFHRLRSMMSQHKLKMCKTDNAGYGGKCITQKDIEDLWNLYIEVHT